MDLQKSTDGIYTFSGQYVNVDRWSANRCSFFRSYENEEKRDQVSHKVNPFSGYNRVLPGWSTMWTGRGRAVGKLWLV